METIEKLVSTNVLDLIDPSDKYKIEEYFPYLRCIKCLEVALEPRQCLTCNYVFCQKCKICSHSLTPSRHVKLILEKITFKCKFNRSGCNSVLKYFELRQHLLNCKFFDVEWISSNKSIKPSDPFNIDKSVQLSNSFNLSSNTKTNPETLSNSILFSSYNFKHENYEGKVNVKCLNCGFAFNNKQEFIDHFKFCDFNKNQEDLIKKFSQTHEILENKFLSYIQDRLNQRKVTQINNFNTFDNFLKNKRNQIKEIESQISRLSGDDNTKDDPEYVEILNKENNLNQTKSTLTEILAKKIEEFENLLQKNEKEIEITTCEHKNFLLELELEEKWAREDLENSMFCSDFDDKCTNCGNEDQTKKKYLCQSCRGKFCVDLCARQCKSKECNKFICPNESKDCKLCHKVNYCDSCKRKCFYQGCLNTFCPECYKKNEHQARNQNINCKFFTCEKDQICECLMTSLFCSKCEKRLCNKCVMNDKEHFPFLK